ncbi:hypothetical protein EDB83DRAFT_310247 [Lactarius deliciosus]|nr:hypothetical protein EDB83DRAFT_310247 [Lactarius deliciosus]
MLYVTSIISISSVNNLLHMFRQLSVLLANLLAVSLPTVGEGTAHRTDPRIIQFFTSFSERLRAERILCDTFPCIGLVHRVGSG